MGAGILFAAVRRSRRNKVGAQPCARKRTSRLSEQGVGCQHCARGHSALRKMQDSVRGRAPRLLAAARALRHDRENGINGRESNRGIDREASMKRVLSGVFASVLAVAATAAFAPSKPPLKLGGILDMSGLYADITGPGSETAAKQAAEEFGSAGLFHKSDIIPP